jgi:hypothetical protein
MFEKAHFLAALRFITMIIIPQSTQKKGAKSTLFITDHLKLNWLNN